MDRGRKTPNAVGRGKFANTPNLTFARNLKRPLLNLRMFSGNPDQSVQHNTVACIRIYDYCWWGAGAWA
jgi:hypothetical protein